MVVVVVVVVVEVVDVVVVVGSSQVGSFQVFHLHGAAI